MYPANRVVNTGEQLEITMLDSSVHYLTVDRIIPAPEENRITYVLKY